MWLSEAKMTLYSNPMLLYAQISHWPTVRSYKMLEFNTSVLSIDVILYIVQPL